MKLDITTNEDLRRAMILFYDIIKEDKMISPFFVGDNNFFDWNKHIQLMTSFWQNVLFFTGDFEGSPLETHKRVHQKMTTQPIHFERWLDIFNHVLDTYYEGENVEKMKSHAKAIAKVMQTQIF
ncbi:MAG: group III truncated hemoglobin [Chitinophagales bacterium]|nr:group III truncated hemoglobin [Chitinophagales bacterium]